MDMSVPKYLHDLVRDLNTTYSAKLSQFWERGCIIPAVTVFHNERAIPAGLEAFLAARNFRMGGLVIKKAFRKKALQFHPDLVATTGLDPKVAEESMKRLLAAYTCLEKEFSK
jgi:hypothetical protein